MPKHYDKELFLYGIVGDKDPEWGFNAGGVSRWLSEVMSQGGGDILVHVFSKGGDMFEGYAIYALLKNYIGGSVTIRVIGIAASAASIIIMAADDGELEIDSAGWVMIHNAQGGTYGDHRDISKMSKQVEALQSSMENIYAERTGLSVTKIKSYMDQETFFSADKSVELGFADRKVEVEDTVEASVQSLNLAASADVKNLHIPKTMYDKLKLAAETRPANPEQIKKNDMDELKEIVAALNLKASSTKEDVMKAVSDMSADITALKSQVKDKTELVADLGKKKAQLEQEVSDLQAKAAEYETGTLLNTVCKEAGVELSDAHKSALERRAKLYAQTEDEDVRKDIRADMKLYAETNGVKLGSDNALSAKAKRGSVTDDGEEKTFEERLNLQIDSLMNEDKTLTFTEAAQKAKTLVNADETK